MPDTVQIVKVDPSIGEYTEIKQLFLQTCTSCRVTDIEVHRVHNPQLYKMYKACKEKVIQDVEGTQVVERRLWHGTDSVTAKSICHSEFNRSYGNNDSLGRGVNFSTKSGYSMKYCYDTGVKSIILAKVITGNLTLGHFTIDRTTLPAKVHSTVDDMANPSIFVVYHNAAAYPEYLVKFRSL